MKVLNYTEKGMIASRVQNHMLATWDYSHIMQNKAVFHKQAKDYYDILCENMSLLLGE